MATITVNWEFSGRASQVAFDAAQAVADAMEALGSDHVSGAVIDRACQMLGDDWDSESVWAMIENCSFEVVE